MKKLALICGLLFLVVFFWVNTFTKEESSFDAVYPPMTGSTVKSAEMTETPPSSDLPSPDDENAQGPRTYIIVASFDDPELADKMAETYIEKYKAEMTVLPPTSAGNYRISYGSYSSPADAKEAIEKIRKSGFPDAWLLASGQAN